MGSSRTVPCVREGPGRSRRREIGVVSDTHGLIRSGLLRELAGVESIVHAGDVGSEDVLEALRQVAPVTAVAGNVDRAMRDRLPATAVVEVDGLLLYVIHVLAEIDIDPRAAGMAAVLHGHSHRPSSFRRGGVLYLNPGSAGPRRFGLPVTVARLRVSGGRLSIRLIELDGV